VVRQLEDADDWDDAYACESGCGSDETNPTIPCPYCVREIYEDSPRCPHCGQYISGEDAPTGRPQCGSSPAWCFVCARSSFGSLTL